jgi:hypothetical protein
MSLIGARDACSGRITRKPENGLGPRMLTITPRYGVVKAGDASDICSYYSGEGGSSGLADSPLLADSRPNRNYFSRLGLPQFQQANRSINLKSARVAVSRLALTWPDSLLYYEFGELLAVDEFDSNSLVVKVRLGSFKRLG